MAAASLRALQHQHKGLLGGYLGEHGTRDWIPVAAQGLTWVVGGGSGPAGDIPGSLWQWALQLQGGPPS